jgi:hypothetical protein
MAGRWAPAHWAAVLSPEMLPKELMPSDWTLEDRALRPLTQGDREPGALL